MCVLMVVREGFPRYDAMQLLGAFGLRVWIPQGSPIILTCCGNRFCVNCPFSLSLLSIVDCCVCDYLVSHRHELILTR